MAKVKGILHADVMAKAMEDPEFVAAYEEETRKELLQAELERWRKEAGLTSAQVAEKMGIKPPTISRIESNVTRASISTISRYARACGQTITGFTTTHG